MRSHIKYKTDCCSETYLAEFNFKCRKPICQLRISAHPLHIEKMQYILTPKTPIESRICIWRMNCTLPLNACQTNAYKLSLSDWHINTCYGDIAIQYVQFEQLPREGKTDLPAYLKR